MVNCMNIEDFVSSKCKNRKGDCFTKVYGHGTSDSFGSECCYGCCCDFYVTRRKYFNFGTGGSNGEGGYLLNGK